MYKFAFFVLLCLFCDFARADIPDLTTALQNTYHACVGIETDLTDMKRMAGINTVITGVGTGLGVGAIATGFAKKSIDKKIEDLDKLLSEIEKNSFDTLSPEERREFNQKFNSSYADAVKNKDSDKPSIEDLNRKSKKLGYWRTGLLAGNTATNIAGALIANKNKINNDLQSKIDRCIDKVKELNTSISAARVAGEDTNEAQQIYQACREYEFIDLSPVNNRAKGAVISSAIGIVTGGIGTATSAMANSDSIRNNNEDKGKEKEKNLNTASNALAIGTTVASAGATIFNASQIAAIKKVVAVSEKCSEVLK